ncbi:MAG: formylglycine-generating enzyme family protein [Spirochaetaceae bacterium]|jgi:formylglycine-generating enzyme required for sulfatase activity|nr:formylglycine-generating enzyme family protein [Spirochaetaceae bacterium]
MRKAILLGAALFVALLALGCSTGTGEPVDKPPKGFVLVAGGTFTMGSPAEEENRYSDEVEHQVRVKSFYMGKYEVTQREWEEVMGTTLSRQRDTAQTAAGTSGWSLYGEGDSYPMYYVNWLEAVEYCNTRSMNEGLTLVYTIDIDGDSVTRDWNANGYRLPTEAEWEYAAKGGNSSSSYLYSGSDTVGDVAWYNGNSEGTTHPVGTKAPNEAGIYDMSGNVQEWCGDWYGNYGNYGNGVQTDPSGPSSGFGRVLRGGCWRFEARRVRSAYRNGLAPSYRRQDLGFRLVRSL